MSSAEARVGSTVVIAVDGSEQADRAYKWYLQHLHRAGNTVLLVHSMEVPSMPTRESWDKQTQVGQTKKKELEVKYQQLLQANNMDGRFISDFEKPGEFICATAQKEKADFVVMGTRGLGKIRRTIMGSVSDYVVQHAHCPVIVCRK